MNWLKKMLLMVIGFMPLWGMEEPSREELIKEFKEKYGNRSFKESKNEISVQISEKDINLNTLVGGISKLVGKKPLKLLLRACIVSNLSPLKELESLDTLDLYKTQIQDIKGLSELIKLKSLNLGDTSFTNIDALVDLNTLEDLSLPYNQIQDINLLSKLTSLKCLDLHGNNIKDVDGLKNLEVLEDLDLSHNNIENVDALKGLLALEDLNLKSNKIKDIDALENLTKLNELDLQNNPISQGKEHVIIDKLAPLGKLNSLKTLQVTGNKEMDNNLLQKIKELSKAQMTPKQIQSRRSEEEPSGASKASFYLEKEPQSKKEEQPQQQRSIFARISSNLSEFYNNYKRWIWGGAATGVGLLGHYFWKNKGAPQVKKWLSKHFNSGLRTVH